MRLLVCRGVSLCDRGNERLIARPCLRSVSVRALARPAVVPVAGPFDPLVFCTI